MHNADLSRIINSDEVQSMVQPIKKDVKRHTFKRNPLKNLYTFLKHNRYAKTVRRMALLAEAQRVKAKKGKLDKKRTQLPKEEAAAIKAAGPAWYKTMISDSECLVFSISDFTARETLESFATNLMHCFQQFYVIPAPSTMAASNRSPVFALALI